MQNMQKYFGFKVKVSEYLEPTDFNIIRNKLYDLIQQGRLDPSKYRIYMHQLALEGNSSHFGICGGIEGRIDKIYLKFSINQKQRKLGDIQFVNNLFNKEIQEDNRPFYLPYEIGYTIPSTFFRDRAWFQNVLITLVRVGLKENHKKIKVKVSVDPKAEFLERLQRNGITSSETFIDINFDKAIEFNRSTPMFVGSELNQNIERSSGMETENKSASTTVIISGGTIGGLQIESPGASQSNPVSVLNSPELFDHVLKELRTLYTMIQKDQPSKVPEKDMGIIEGVLAEAPKHPAALVRLKSLGKWFIPRVESVGLSLLSSVIEGGLGI